MQVCFTSLLLAALDNVTIGVGSGGAREVTHPPPQVSSWGGGASPPNFTHCLHNELHCNIVMLLTFFLICVN